MVVIKDSRANLEKEFGKSFIGRIQDFSEVIGYTLEEDGDEIRVEFNPDRPDLFSFHAMDRSMKCYYDKDYWIPQELHKSGVHFVINGDVQELRRYAIGFVARGKEIGNNLDHLIEYQERMHESIGKNRSKVSIGLHDLDKLEEPFTYRAIGNRDVTFTTFDEEVTGTASEILSKHPKGVEYGHLIPSEKEVPVILDSSGDVLSMPPIINGTKSRVEPSTRNFFIDITGTDRKATRDTFFLLLYEFRNLGYSIFAVQSDKGASAELEAETFDGRRLQLSQKELKKITGISIKQGEAIGILRKMGYIAEPSSTWVDVSVPGNRIDVMGPVDVIEDLVKGYGLSNVKEMSMDLPLIGDPNPANDFAGMIRDAMIGIGMQEVRTFVVSSAQNYNKLQYRGGLEVRNPKSLDYSVVRDRLHINILELLRINKRRSLPHKVFEIGEVYEKGEQETKFCAMIMDSRTSYSSIKQVLDYIARRMGIGEVEITPKREEGFIEGRVGEVFLNGNPAGVIGEVDPEILTRFDLAAPVSAMELDLAVLMSLAK